MSAAMIDHLWQSSLFAGFAWLLTLLLRHEGAHIRYWIWFVASLKFLVPFSLLAMFGSQTSAVPGMPFAGAVQQAAAPVVAPAATLMPVSPESGVWQVALFVWALGCAGLLLRWFALWLGVRSSVRAARFTMTVGSLRVMTSPTLHEPGIVGIFRPVLLLPEGIADRLTTQQLQTILDHEMCHARRRDNLTAAAHMMVEAVFWFHPLVWWIGARLVDERERACDEHVLRSGNEPRTYAEGILRVCQFYLASKLACIPGVSGAQLKMRLEAIMKNRVVKNLSRSKTVLLGVVAVATIGVPFVGGMTASAEAAKSPAAATTVGKIELIDGKKVKLHYKNVEVRGLIQAIAEAAKVNVLVSDKVSGTVTVNLAELPWEQALDIVLGSQGLTKKEKNGIIFVEPA
jgi:beta-lactamase regulating signal transducer with metallopeptidase domain